MISIFNTILWNSLYEESLISLFDERDMLLHLNVNFELNFILFMCICVHCECVSDTWVYPRRPEEVFDPLELDFEAIVSSPKCGYWELILTHLYWAIYPSIHIFDFDILITFYELIILITFKETDSFNTFKIHEIN